MTQRSICLPAAEMEGKSAPQTLARRTNAHESSLSDALDVSGSIRAAPSRNINRVLMQVVYHKSNPVRIRTVDLLITNQEGLKSVRLAMNRASWATLSSWFLDFAMEIGIVRDNRDQSPISRRCSHWRNSPSKPMRPAILKLAMTHRSICLPDLPAGSQVRRYCLRGLTEVSNKSIAFDGDPLLRWALGQCT
jgi:hypothetical protein